MMLGVWMGCAHAVAPVGEVLPLRVRGATLRAHVADEPLEREHGLMEVTELGADEGMVFVYPSAALRYFWMKHTPTALAIAFCDDTGKVVELAEMKPLDLTLTPSKAPAMYVIEANQGWFSAHGVARGDTVVGLPSGSAR